MRHQVRDWEILEDRPTIEPIRPTARQLAARKARRDSSRDNRKRAAVTRK